MCTLATRRRLLIPIRSQSLAFERTRVCGWFESVGVGYRKRRGKEVKNKVDYSRQPTRHSREWYTRTFCTVVVIPFKYGRDIFVSAKHFLSRPRPHHARRKSSFVFFFVINSCFLNTSIYVFYYNYDYFSFFIPTIVFCRSTVVRHNAIPP